MSTVTARSLVCKVFRYWGWSGSNFNVRRIEMILGGEVMQLPGYANGGLFTTAASEIFAGAVSILRGAIWAAETLVTGSRETGEPDHASIGLTLSSWYKWTAPSSGTVYIDTRGSGYEYDPLGDNVPPEWTGLLGDYGKHTVSVYIGDSVDNLALVAESTFMNPYEPNGSWKTFTAFSFVAVAGQEYKIALSANDPLKTFRINVAMFEAYESFPTVSLLSAEYVFLPYSNKEGLALTSYQGIFSSGSTFDSVTGYPIGKEYLQFVLVLGEELSFDQIAITNGYDLGGVLGARELQLSITDYPVLQADAENDTAPIPDEVLVYDSIQGEIGPEDIPKNIAYEDFIIGDFYIGEKGLIASVGIGGSLQAGMTVDDAVLDASVGFCAEIEATIKPVANLACGLGIGMQCSGIDTYKPAEVLAGIGIASMIEAEVWGGAKVEAGVCIACILEGGNVPQGIIDAAIGFGVFFDAQSKNQCEFNGCVGIGASINGGDGRQLCQIQEFRDTDYF